IIQTTECDAWSKATDNYIGSQASYALEKIRKIKKTYDIEIFLQRLNSAFCGYAEFSNVNNQIQVVNMINEIQCIGNLKK
ncbi:MAG: hypothetical protein K2G12_10885, partial [Prevotella sp.]|nr:hypothetical protein [Prevotella sp.]